MKLESGDAFTFSPIRPEWIPLDEIAQAWAIFSLQATSAHALQAVGTAFLALPFETSAHTHHTQASHRLWRHLSLTVAQSLGQAILDLSEACHQWARAFLWLERFANEESHDEQMLATVRALFNHIQQQQQRLWLLLQHLEEEHRTECGGEPIEVHLGHLSSAAAREKAR